MKDFAAHIKDWAIQIIATVILGVVLWWLNDKPAQSPTVELVMWQGISNSNNPADFQEYIARYPNGQFEVIANNRLRELRQRESDEAQAAELQRQQQLEQQLQVEQARLLELQKQREAEKARAAELQRQQQLEQQLQVEQARLLELQRQRESEEKRLAELERQQKEAEEARRRKAVTRPRYRNNGNGTVKDTTVQNEAAKLQNVDTIVPPTKKRSQLDNWLFGRGTSQ